MPISSAGVPSPTRRYDSQCYRSPLCFILKCAVMFLVISLFLLFLGFAAIIVTHFLFMSTAFHRRSKKPIPDLHPLLHDVVYPDTAAAATDASDCAICLDPFRQGDHCMDIPACKHLFHACCLDRWMKNKPNCPVCRSPVEIHQAGISAPSSIDGRAPWKRIFSVDLQGAETSY